MSLNENKAGGTSPDADDYNAVVDAVVALQAGGGGSQPGVEVVRVPISFDTPGFVIAAAGPSGIALCTLDAGDLLVGTAGGTYSLSCLPTTIGFDGTTPTLGFVTTAGRGNMPGTPPDSDKTVLLGSQNADWDAGGILKRVPHDDPLGQVLICATPTTLWGYLFDGLGADPESTMGDGEIVLFVARATT